LTLSKTGNSHVVRIPFVVSPVAIQLELAAIPIQFKDVLVAVAVRFV
jgi:antitoxin component of MazEF toxin-antitoxin module